VENLATKVGNSLEKATLDQKEGVEPHVPKQNFWKIKVTPFESSDKESYIAEVKGTME
jgi:hypothetical protein